MTHDPRPSSGPSPSPSRDDWQLHPRLLADSLPILQHDGVQFRLVNDRRFVWVLIVPMHPGAEQLHRLPPTLRETTLQALQAVSATLEQCYRPKRLNVGAIGNLVDQLHVHCVARTTEDPAWPGVVWGAGERQPLAPLESLARVRAIAAGLTTELARHSETN
ncbi:HIT domain-containing protein [Guyparkeria sp. 1SP6A2]|nr:HIT domain-containing protein [Guyparkeria sp. 1SP6A2]